MEAKAGDGKGKRVAAGSRDGQRKSWQDKLDELRRLMQQGCRNLHCCVALACEIYQDPAYRRACKAAGEDPAKKLDFICGLYSALPSFNAWRTVYRHFPDPADWKQDRLRRTIAEAMRREESLRAIHKGQNQVRMNLAVDQVWLDEDMYAKVDGARSGRMAWVRNLVLAERLQADPGGLAAMEPIRVVANKQNGGPGLYAILDGYGRYLAARRAGFSYVPAVVEDVPAGRAFVRSARLHWTSGGYLTVPAKAYIVARLTGEFGYSKRQVCRMLSVSPERLEYFLSRATPLTPQEAQALPPGQQNRSVNGQPHGFVKGAVASALHRRPAGAVLAAQRPVAGRDLVQVLASLEGIFAAGVKLADVPAEAADHMVAIIKQLANMLAGLGHADRLKEASKSVAAALAACRRRGGGKP